MAHCTSCLEEISHGEVRYALDEVYCERCFDDLFTYCCRCDRLLYREDTNWDNDGDPYCADCYEDDYDHECPDNPDVSEADRKLIIELSRGFLYDKPVKKALIRINREDYFLPKLRGKVGLIDNPIYVYGLADKEGREILASKNLIESIKTFLQVQNLNWLVSEDTGVNRIGINYTLRKNHLEVITALIKEAATTKELLPA